MNNNKVRIVALSNYEQPEIKEVSWKEYVTFGVKNSFFDYLIDVSRSSVTNGACVSSISNLVYGKGLNAHDKARKPNEWAQLLSLFKPEDVRKIVDDLKRLGQAAIQCQWQGGHKSIKTATHFPVHTLAMDKNLKGDVIQGYFYAKDWAKVKTDADLKRIPALGTSREGIEILIIRPYQAGLFWFGLPDNQSGLKWADLESEIATYHNSAIKRSFAPSMFISLNNGMPNSEDEADEIVKKMKEQYQGSENAGNIIISFAESKETESTITPVVLSDLPQQYEFLSKEASFKILSSHKVPSPLLLGIPIASGFSSNAEELRIASLLLETYVLNPQRQLLIEGFNKILTINEITLDIFFDSLNPFEEVEEVDVDMTKLSNDDKVTDLFNLSNDEYVNLLDDLKFESLSDEWQLVDVREMSDKNDSIQDWAESKITQLAVIKSDPNAKSSLDKDLFKVRYKYEVGKQSEGKSREFCTQMMARTGRGVVYRHDDIAQASFRGVNGEFAHAGGRYSLFKYKGGPYCHHIWNELLYRRKTKTNGEPFEDKALSSNKKVKSIPGFKPNPTGKKESEIAPDNMKGTSARGHHPAWNKEHGIT